MSVRSWLTGLAVTLCTYQEMRIPVMHIPDDATEEELRDMAAERRQLAMEQRERATADTSGPVAYAVFRRTDADLPSWDDELYGGYASDIADMNN